MSNYEWQKQHSKQRIDSRMREAELHRMAADAPAAPRRNPLAAVLRALTRVFPSRRHLPTPNSFTPSGRQGQGIDG